MIRNSTRSGGRPAGGFTLAELLTVLAVVVLLLALLLPVLSRARRSANAVVCVAGLRQVHTLFILYANDADGALPVVRYTYDDASYTRWIHYLAPYDASWTGLFVPDGPTVLAACPEWRPFADASGYGMNPWPLAERGSGLWFRIGPSMWSEARIDEMNEDWDGTFFKLPQWSNPSSKALVSDMWGHDERIGTWPFMDGVDPSSISPRDYFCTIDFIRHASSQPSIYNPSVNVLHVDGHVELLNFVDAHGRFVP